jgi:hypothetical protein
LSIDEHERIDEWEIFPKIIAKIQNPNDRKSIALGISRILRRRYRNNMSVDIGRAIKALAALEKSGELPEDNDDDDGNLNYFNSDLIELFERLARKRGKF